MLTPPFVLLARGAAEHAFAEQLNPQLRRRALAPGPSASAESDGEKGPARLMLVMRALHLVAGDELLQISRLSFREELAPLLMNFGALAAAELCNEGRTTGLCMDARSEMLQK